MNSTDAIWMPRPVVVESPRVSTRSSVSEVVAIIAAPF